MRRILLALLAVSLSACTSKPSDSDAVRLFNEENRQLNAEEFFDIENVRRVDGYEKEGRYIVEMQFDLVPKADYDEVVATLMRRAGDDFIAKSQLSMSVLPQLKNDLGVFKKGQRITKKRPMLLQRTESGWALAR